jgi:cellulose synthase/poly-beta-1,6-N-acetylglucosamine synthase-like glycosyltransferase
MIAAAAHIFFLILFIWLSVTIIYLLIAAVAGRLPVKRTRTGHAPLKKIAVLITSFKEDEVIINTVASAVNHDYDKNFFRVFLAADQLKPATIMALGSSGASVYEVHFERGSKARSLNYLLNTIDENEYDIAIVLDGDNIMLPGSLRRVNDAFAEGFRAVQIHRMAKNTNGPVARLDAISEEINNHLFRKAQRNMGLSAATIGSGMAFEFLRLKQIYNKPGILDNPACDREVDFEMMKHNIIVGYLDDVFLLDEKVSKRQVFENQRRRWLESQLIHLGLFRKEQVPDKTKDYWNKLFINLLPPRILFIGLIGLIVIILFLSRWLNYDLTGIKPSAWLGLFFLYFLALFLSVPRQYLNIATAKALLALPVLLVAFLKAALTVKPKRKVFIHTPKSFSGDRDSQIKH